MARVEVEEIVALEPELDGLGRAHEPELLEQTAPPARPCVGRDTMIYILLWLLGAPLTLILILFLLGVGR
ncbi:MAG: hypothetical protein ACRELZ_14735 [Candidatus Rokuibacteriota bacterium]